ncbi:MAG: LLM class flavin-dependent oxidoreductase [Candidatus Bathyarchaeia archaeon]
MKTPTFGLFSPVYPWSLVGELALSCEEAGFDIIGMPDHTVYLPSDSTRPKLEALEAWTALSALAVNTKRIRLAVTVSDVFRHHPVALAHMATTLDLVSGGRAILGIGPGEDMNTVPYGMSRERSVSKMYDAVKLIRRLWAHDLELADFDGEFYKLSKAFMVKSSRRPPIWIAANSPRTIRIAAELADGWLPGWIPPELYREKLSFLQQSAAGFGRNSSGIEKALLLFFSIAKNRDEALKNIEMPAKTLTLFYPTVLKRLGYDAPQEFNIDKVIPSDSEMMKRQRVAAMNVPFEGIAEKMVLWGTVEDAIERIVSYVESGVETFLLRPIAPSQKMLDMVRFFAQEIISYFRNQ